MEDAEERQTPLLDTAEKLQEFRGWLKPWGAWDDAQIEAMNNQELNALFLQWIAGDCREDSERFYELPADAELVSDD